MEKRINMRDIWLIAISLGLITLLHYYTIIPKWDIHEFYRRLYYIPIIMASFKFRLKGGVITSFLVALLYLPHFKIYFGIISIYALNQILELVMFVVIGTVTGFLVESDYKKKQLLEKQIEQLTNLENYTQSILDSITNVFIALDKDLRIKSINKEGKELFDINDDLGYKDLSNIFESYSEVEEILKRVLSNNRRELGIETKYVSRYGHILYVRLYAYPLRNTRNKPEGIVVVLEDISEIRSLENQIRRADKLSATGELASGVAHEIRNPLGIIKTISQTIIKDIDDRDAREGIEIIISEVNRANNVIKGLLDFAKPSMGSPGLHSIDKVIRGIILITYKYAQQHRVKINYEYEDATVLIDEEKIKQAFINILFNGIQAMPKGGNLNIVVGKNDEWVKISFEDEGSGIPSDKLEKIFEPFYTTRDNGTGLGLSITHRIIEEHRGFIEVKSVVGRGTTIDIYLPLENKEDSPKDEKDIDSR